MLLIPYICLFWLSTSGLWAVQAEDPISDNDQRTPHRGLAPANVDFAFSLCKQLVVLAPGRNIFISPVSISMGLAVLSLGARGSTRTQLFQGLGFNLTETPEVEIHQGFQNLHHLLGESDTSFEMTMGNALFLGHHLEPLESFSENSKHYYQSEAVAMDFQDWVNASRQINEYIRNKTQGKIEDLFPELESTANLILANYIFLKGTWAHPFDPERTLEEDFHVNSTSAVKVPFMSQLNTVRYFKDSVLPCEVIQLDYTGNETVFFILPEDGEIDTVINALSRDTIQRWSDSLSLWHMYLSIPKFSFSGVYDLSGVLADMGLADLFTDRANFSGITPEAPLKVSKVVHKAVLYLDETGIKGSAVASEGGQKLTVNSTDTPYYFKLNRPFIIAMFDNFTWSSLFLGKVLRLT
ncbi:PREDICTED: corticosteroid-binding globulin [Elephantulus edwardii]|uniref:corticosteroid-binding globulin n=1 Tax=Elephantulus edwardii TaxID=28737 RepID=UPI0003F0A804|nr:PREDICTED: corticosteroid-binding globulin [Elephantulus edwardii]